MDKKRNLFALLVITPIALISFCACGVSSPGQALNWNSPAAASTSTPSPSIAAATAPATPAPPDAGLSWGAIWNNLNQNTGQVAKGQYALLQLFEGELTSQIDGLLSRSN
jgi:hypothetical protein